MSPTSLEARAERACRARARRRCSSARGDSLLGMIAVADVIKPDSPQAIASCENMGIDVVMLTGDNERTAEAIGAQAGVDRGDRGRAARTARSSVIRELQAQRQGRHGRRRHQRRARAHARGRRHRHRRGHGRRDRRGGRGADEEPAVRRCRRPYASAARRCATSTKTCSGRSSTTPSAFRSRRACSFRSDWTLNPMFGAAAMSLSSFCVVIERAAAESVQAARRGSR